MDATAHTPSTRAQLITRRTYNRPLPGGGFESWTGTIDRVIGHQQWLWNRASLRASADELRALRALLLDRKTGVSGRTLWLGGTETARRREASQFNCSFSRVESVNDVVDCYWLLLQGCGVGFLPIIGSLSGFARHIAEIEVIRSKRRSKGGEENNVETWNPDSHTWTIKVGDSAEGWSKTAGKLLAGKYPARRLVIDLSEIRPAGGYLAGYGWTSLGDEQLSVALPAIAAILNKRAGQLLTKIDILDVMNWLGTTLSSRRAAEIGLIEYGDPEWRAFATSKDQYWLDNQQRAQSNNSLMFWSRPSRAQLAEVFDMMLQCGGSEPGFVNAEAARLRAPWFAGINPCGEVLLGNKAFCNLAEVNVARFKDDFLGLQRAVWLMARASYRQTLVDLNDGILSPAWHQQNEFMRLCGVGLTGIARRPDLTPYDYRQLRAAAHTGAHGMAQELGTQPPKNVTTVKPSGTMSKIMDTTEGVHVPPGRYIFNNVSFREVDPLVDEMRAASYHTFPSPFEPGVVVVRLPVEWADVPFETVAGRPVNRESAVSQLERYKMLMTNWCDQNVSITVSYDNHEIPEITEWLDRNWDTYVGVTFMPRLDPTKTAEDVGYAYLPQEVVTKEVFTEYAAQLRPLDIDKMGGNNPLADAECAGGACPIR